MSLLRREHAPITDAAWEAVEDEARDVLAPQLSARRIVDVRPPEGWKLAAVNLGRLEPVLDQKADVRAALRTVQPLLELRADFTVDLWELDGIERGLEDPELDDLRRAATAVARFEENAIYQGLAEAGIAGLLESSEADEPVTVAPEPAALPDAVSRAVLRLRYAGVEGPYGLALGAALYRLLDAGTDSYPVRRRIAHLIGGPIVLAPYLEGGVLVSGRGGDTELTLGQDLSIGYHSDDGRQARLFLTESFSFRVLGPEAVSVLKTEGVG